MPDAAATPPPAAQVSAITTCKSRLAHLQQTLPRLMAQGFQQVIVVDYDCPERSGDWAEANHPGVTVVRVPAAPIFHVAHARNLGAAAATAPWLLFIDVDVLAGPDFLASASERLTERHYFHAAPLQDELTGTIFIARADFVAIGGYDEAIQGWGSEDEDIAERLLTSGRRRGEFDGATISPIRHSQAERTRHHQVADGFVSNQINWVYRNIKRDLGRLGHTLDLPARKRIHAQVSGAFLSAEGPTSIEIRFREQDMGPRGMTTAFRYIFSPTKPDGA